MYLCNQSMKDFKENTDGLTWLLNKMSETEKPSETREAYRSVANMKE